MTAARRANAVIEALASFRRRRRRPGRARRGAPTLSRRSDSDSAPPRNMMIAPSQINRTSGLK